MPDSDTLPDASPLSGGKITSPRDALEIPDYTLLKRIGSGAYGEVWLAQSITGALRAVKIVWREDFELTSSFHREFEGIQQFEPISRGHPGLVHILHVGWNEHRGFYYCVMELADDIVKGPAVDDVKAYQPRTISSDMRAQGRLPVGLVRETGIHLAGALGYMHRHGLSHRDIKPSNVIFVDGVHKLADIGLVAATGEHAFVGTEGFVPPEGPGTPQADLYSLGKVLYEMSTGNDRMEFPELPSDLRPEEWPAWRALNRVICKACAPNPSDRFSSADQMLLALEAAGSPEKKPLAGRFMRHGIGILFTSMLTAVWLQAWLYQQSWETAIVAPQRTLRAPPQPPVEGKPWRNRYNKTFTADGNIHRADLPLDFEWFNRFLNATAKSFEGRVVTIEVGRGKVNVVLLTGDDADAFCRWQTEMDRRAGYLDARKEYVWRKMDLPDTLEVIDRLDLLAVRCEVVMIPSGTLWIDSDPPGAEVWDDDEVLGQTPLELQNARAGAFEYQLKMQGYESQLVRGQVRADDGTAVKIVLRANGAVVFGKPWANHLDMHLVPLGRVMIGINEVTRGVFRRHTELSLAGPPATDGESDDENFPASALTFKEAADFCQWLTARERALGLLDANQAYRLPTDDEWSMAAYLPREKGSTPEERNWRIEGIYPWGFTWPPPSRSGNFADESAMPGLQSIIEGYSDGFPGPSPVASFRADGRGVTDLAGNVWEWVSDPWSATDRSPVARGGSYLTADRRELLASYRRKLELNKRYQDVGFRVVLAPVGVMARDEE
jgi:serine/threonine protein kinase/formylglycine-generating enzyme required for sulfatase activity